MYALGKNVNTSFITRNVTQSMEVLCMGKNVQDFRRNFYISDIFVTKITDLNANTSIC